jgi:hypothetical protein
MANGWALGKFAGEFAPTRRLTLGSSNLVYFLRAYFAYTASHVRFVCRFSDAGNDETLARSGSRRSKSAKARNRGR